MATSTPVLTVGPVPLGANGGNAFNDGIFTGIRSMMIYHESILWAIRVEYDRNGQPVSAPMHGSVPSTQVRANPIRLDFPNEFLVSIFGTCTTENLLERKLVIRTITFQSNKNTYGPYGTPIEGAQTFSTASTGCKIIGFHGRKGMSVDSLGTYLVPQDLISVGPFGGPGGNPFDDGTFPAIRKLKIRHGDGFVSMQTVYDNNGQNQLSGVHGQIVGGTTLDVDLALDEYLISIAGFYTEGSNPVVQSLTFQSNKATYGPYGTAQGTPFSTLTTAGTGKIIGFHGTSDDYINSIAAYFEPLTDTP